MYPLNGALPVHVVCVITGYRYTYALIAHRYTYARARCRTSQYRKSFILFKVSLLDDLGHSVFDVMVLAGFKSRTNAHCWCELIAVSLSSAVFLIFISMLGIVVYGLRYCAAGVLRLINKNCLLALHC